MTARSHRSSDRPHLRPALAASLLALAPALLIARQAHAQYGGPGAPGSMPAPPMGQEPKEEGPAEQAPEEEGRPSDLEPLPGYPEQQRKRIQIFEIDGYLRTRGDYLHNFFLGQGYTNIPVPPAIPGSGAQTQTFGTPPFPVPLGCPIPSGTSIGTSNQNCSTKGMGAANFRLRLEPTLNVTDQVRVHAQIDVLDNTILGSTPDSLVGVTRSPADPAGVAPTPLLSNSQDPPEIGQNGYTSSIRAKRAWGEVDSELGSLRFGRMPWNFGRGILYNDGSCPDCDQGTTVDRLMALTELYGHQIAASWDFGAQGLTSAQINLGRDNPGGYPYDLSQDDDVVQFMAAITKIDNPVQLRERIDRGDLVVNYGLQVVYRSQQLTAVPNTMSTSNTTYTALGVAPTREQALPNTLATINGLLVTPDLWLKLYFKNLTVEMEGVGVFGKADNGGGILAADPSARITFRQFGWVLASELKLYRDSFFIGFETGGASGDQAENRANYLNYRWKFVQQPPGDHSINDFKFSPEYHVDEIFFRHIMGTVTNAIYFKPRVAYWFDLQQNRQIGLAGSVIYSFAPIEVSTPGNAASYGIEMDLGATYRNTAEGFYAGVTWGVFWPMAALDRPANIWGGSTDPMSAQATDATAAQVVRTFFGIRF